MKKLVDFKKFRYSYKMKNAIHNMIYKTCYYKYYILQYF